jgi:hypothetical protein
MSASRYTEHTFVFECGTVVSLRLPPNITSVQVHIAPVGQTSAGSGSNA